MEERNFRTYPHDLEDLEQNTNMLSVIEDIMKIFPLLVESQRGQMVTTVMDYDGAEVPLHRNKSEGLSYGKYMGLNIGAGAHIVYSKKEAREYALWLSALVEASSVENEDFFAWVSINKYDIEDDQLVEEVAALHWMIADGEIFSISNETFVEQEASYFEQAQLAQEDKISSVSIENRTKIMKILAVEIIKLAHVNDGSVNRKDAVMATATKFATSPEAVLNALEYAQDNGQLTVDGDGVEAVIVLLS
jgi:hypothetical protein